MMEELEDIDDFYLSIQSDFIYFWCKEYGLPDMVVEYLDKSGCRSKWIFLWFKFKLKVTFVLKQKLRLDVS